MNYQDQISLVPTTRYQGSKRKILPWIYDCVKACQCNTILDAFGGSGTVSYLFKCMGKKVVYNDIFTFNHIIGESIIENNSVLLNASDVEFILHHNEVCQDFISTTFKDIYFLDEENKWLDMIIHNIEDLSSMYSNQTLRYKKAIAYNALFQSCMIKRPYNLFHRKNLDMRTRDVARHFGNKTTWDKPFVDHFKSFIDEINRAVFNSGKRCSSICKDVFEIKSNRFDLVYLDPPYIKKQGYRNEGTNYLKYYHFLEGIANYSTWEKLIDVETNNICFKTGYFQNYFTPSRAVETFDRLIHKFRDSIIVLSYRYGGTPTIDELMQIVTKYKPDITVYDRPYSYALNKQNGNTSFNREYIIIGR